MVQISPALLGRVDWARKSTHAFGVVLRYDDIMKRARVVAGVICAIAVVTLLSGKAGAERLRRGPADPANPHITAASQYHPAGTISGRRAPRTAGRRGAAPGGRGCLAASIAISGSETRRSIFGV